MIVALREYITGDFDPLDLEDLAFYDIHVFTEPHRGVLFSTVQGNNKAIEIAVAECKRRWPHVEIEHDDCQIYPASGMNNLAIISPKGTYTR